MKGTLRLTVHYLLSDVFDGFWKNERNNVPKINDNFTTAFLILPEFFTFLEQLPLVRGANLCSIIRYG